MIVIVVSLFGNILVLITILRTKSMRNHTNYYLCNLAVSDILVTGICMWVHLGQTISRDWPFGPVLCVIVPFLRSKYIQSTLYITLVKMTARLHGIGKVYREIT